MRTNTVPSPAQELLGEILKLHIDLCNRSTSRRGGQLGAGVPVQNVGALEGAVLQGSFRDRQLECIVKATEIDEANKLAQQCILILRVFLQDCADTASVQKGGGKAQDIEVR